MNSLSVDEAAVRNGGRQTGDSLACTLSYAQHRRSKSASSDQNLSGEKNSLNVPKNIADSHESLPLAKRRVSPLHSHSNGHTKRASLEKDIEQLQSRLQQERSVRMVLERAMGRASSTLSPGHHHVAAQTKELIAEIELLEEEVANREQHVLDLYKSIFEQCISRSSSEQTSVISSPAHVKNEARRHPSVISSAFCSSKKFPLQTFQAFASSGHDPGKRNFLQYKTRHSSLVRGTANIHFERSYADKVKVQDQSQMQGKTSVLRTLKDHLNQCPCKLSEEMVRCMAAVYCWLRSPTTTTNFEQNRSPLLSRSSTNVILPRRSIGEDKEWQGKSTTTEISWISTDKNLFSHASYAINNYRLLVEQLERVSVKQMGNDAQLAFWINIYNSLVMHAYLAYGIPHSSLRRLALFHKAAYSFSSHSVNVDAIEQSIFCFRTARMGKWLETIMSSAIKKRCSQERQHINSILGLQNSQPLVCFALCTGAFSDPTLRVYTGSNVREELEAAKREFLQANIVVKKSKKVYLPKVLERYMKEASIPGDDLLEWIAENVDKKLHDSLKKCIDRSKNKKSSQVIEWLPYSTRFRYVFSRDLTEKPWWV